MNFQAITHLFLANSRMFFRVRQEIFWVFFLPVFLLILLGPVLKDMAGIGSLRPEDVNFPIGVVDHDNTAASRRFIENLSKATEFTVVELSEDEAIEEVRSTRQRMVVIFPPGFEKSFHESEAKLTLVTDARAAPLTEMALNILRENFEIIIAAHSEKELPITFVRRRIRTIDTFFDFIDFLVPGIMAMAVMTSCIFSLAPTIVRLREQGVMRRLWVTPLSRLSFVASHVLFRLFIAITQTGLILLVGFTLFRPNLAVPALSVLTFVVLGNLNGTAISFVIAGNAKTPEVASTIANVVSIPMLMLCGVFLPLEIMPPKILPLVWLLPLTHLSEGLRSVMSLEKGFWDMWRAHCVLAGYLLGLFLLSLATFKWDKATSGRQ